MHNITHAPSLSAVALETVGACPIDNPAAVPKMPPRRRTKRAGSHNAEALSKAVESAIALSEKLEEALSLYSALALGAAAEGALWAPHSWRNANAARVLNNELEAVLSRQFGDTDATPQ